jgi:hypothetical protein
MFSVLSETVILIGHGQPLSEALAILHLNLCEPPCWIGITPGTTKWSDIEQKIRVVYPYAEIQNYTVEGGDGPLENVTFRLLPRNSSYPQAKIVGSGGIVTDIEVAFVDINGKGSLSAINLAPSALELATQLTLSNKIWDMKRYCQLTQVSTKITLHVWGAYKRQEMSQRWRAAILSLSSTATDDNGEMMSWMMCIVP